MRGERSPRVILSESGIGILPMNSSEHRLEAAATASAASSCRRCGDLLMANVFGGGGVNRIFGDVGGVVAYALEVARNKHQVDVTAQLFRIACHAIDQLPAHLG